MQLPKRKTLREYVFVGKVGIKEFLETELGPQKPGQIIDQNGKVLGDHEGSLYYTIGQRHGLNVGGGLPYYVTGKDVKNNQVFVTTDISDKNLWNQTLTLSDLHWINEAPNSQSEYTIRTRYRADLVAVKSFKKEGDNYLIELKDEVRAITPGQSAVIYEKERVVGGGIVI